MFGRFDPSVFIRSAPGYVAARPWLFVVPVLVWAVVYLATGPWRRRRPPWREAPMVFLVGRPGSGKTLLAVKMAIERMRQGVPVYANFPLWDIKTGRRAGIVRSWDHLRDLCTLVDEDHGVRNFLCVVDEGNVWATSRKAFDVPTWLLSFWAQRRHYGLELIITAQHENRVDVVLRETVDLIGVCERVRWLPKWVPLFKRQDCYPEDLEALRAGKAGQARYHFVPHCTYAGYDTAGIVQYVDFKENREKRAKGDPIEDVPIVHPSYLPGTLPGADASSDPISSEALRSWIESDDGRAAMRALGD